MIAFDSVSKRFGRLQVLQDVSLTLERGSSIALIGPNGCGKTTLIKSLLGMVIPDSGEIRFDGKLVDRDHQYRRRIGYMPQIGRYPENMRIGQVINMIRDIRQHPGTCDETLYRAYEMEKLLNKKMRTLSGGTTQKVSAVLAFLFQPEVLILDEPTAGLDPLASEILKDKILAEKEQGKLILITSHLLSELDELITHVLFMQDGKVHFFKPVGDLLAETKEERIGKAIAHYLTRQRA